MMIGAYWYTIASVTGLPWVVVRAGGRGEAVLRFELMNDELREDVSTRGDERAGIRGERRVGCGVLL